MPAERFRLTLERPLSIWSWKLRLRPSVNTTLYRIAAPLTWVGQEDLD